MGMELDGRYSPRIIAGMAHGYLRFFLLCFVAFLFSSIHGICRMA